MGTREKSSGNDLKILLLESIHFEKGPSNRKEDSGIGTTFRQINSSSEISLGLISFGHRLTSVISQSLDRAPRKLLILSPNPPVDRGNTGTRKRILGFSFLDGITFSFP
jgi:hypothetical protein